MTQKVAGSIIYLSSVGATVEDESGWVTVAKVWRRKKVQGTDKEKGSGVSHGSAALYWCVVVGGLT